MGSVPPVDSITISDQKTPVLMWTEAIFDMAMLSSFEPNSRDFTRLTRCGLITSFVGKRKLPCVHRLAAKVSAGEESIGWSGIAVIYSNYYKWKSGPSGPRQRFRVFRALAPVVACREICPSITSLHPLQRAFLPHPDVAHNQDGQKDQHLDQAKQAEGLELHRPGEKKNRLHV